MPEPGHPVDFDTIDKMRAEIERNPRITCVALGKAFDVSTAYASLIKRGLYPTKYNDARNPHNPPEAPAPRRSRFYKDTDRRAGR